MSDYYGMRLEPQHAQSLKNSGITPEHARARGYVSVDTKKRLESIGITSAGRNVPGLLVPLLRVDGTTWGYQYRPDRPRERGGRPVKYETPVGQHNGIDVPPGAGPNLADPTIPLWVTEGSKKADAAALAGLCCIALPGVWSWRGSNARGGKTAVPDWADVALNGRRVILAFDGDVARKRSVRSALDALGAYLASKGAMIEYLHLPDDQPGKTGLDDYLAAGATVTQLLALVRPEPPEIATGSPMGGITESGPGSPELSPSGAVERPAPAPVTLEHAHQVFRRWLHMDDTAPLLAVAATVAANLAPGDPVWLLIVGPPSGGKTEILSSTASLPYMVPAATVTEAALLSGTSKRERTKAATGGLLRQVGDFGILLAKDFTSVLSQNRDTARSAMAALREVYDGSWDRPVGTDGGRVLRWAGKCGFVGGVTPSYDRYGTIVNTLGDRFLLLRLPDVAADAQALSALANGDHEQQMRADLAAAMTGLVTGADLTRVHAPLLDAERDRLVRLASFAATARTAVERDGYTGDLLVMPQAEGPARLVKAMRRLHGALGAIGADDDTRWSVLVRVARDCAPAIRLPLMRVLLAAAGPMRTAEVAEAAGMVTKTTHRQLDDLALLGIAARTKATEATNSPDLWSASDWLRVNWPKEVGQRCTPRREGEVKAASADTPTAPTAKDASSGGRTSLSHPGDLPPAPEPEPTTPAECPHGQAGGADPDPWVRGRLSCPRCAAEARDAS